MGEVRGGNVDERIRKIRANGNTVSSVNIAILAALNFADELERLKREHQELIDRITAMKERLIDAIDGKLAQERRRRAEANKDRRRGSGDLNKVRRDARKHKTCETFLRADRHQLRASGGINRRAMKLLRLAGCASALAIVSP